MDPLKLAGRAFAELGSASWLLVRAVRGAPLDVLQMDGLGRRRLAAAMAVFIWRPLPTLCGLAALVGVIAGFSAAAILKVYHAEIAVTPALAHALAQEVTPLLIGVFAAGRVSVALAARLGGMQLGRELQALEALGVDPTRYVLTPSLVAIVLGAAVHGVAAIACAWAVAGCMLQLKRRRALGALCGADPDRRQLPRGADRHHQGPGVLADRASVGAAVGSREVRDPAAVGAQATAAFTAGLLGVFIAAALWTALL